MTTTLTPNVYNPDSWKTGVGISDATWVLCPTCVVPMPLPVAYEHVEKRHSVQMREAIVHLNDGNLDSIVKAFFVAPYRNQLAAIHSRENWTPEDVEKVLAVIYQYQANNGVIAVLESSWDLAQKAALDWHYAELRANNR